MKHFLTLFLTVMVMAVFAANGSNHYHVYYIQLSCEIKIQLARATRYRTWHAGCIIYACNAADRPIPSGIGNCSKQFIWRTAFV